MIIDFSYPAAVEKALPYCQTHKLSIVVCTTGLSEELQLKVVQLSRSVPVFMSANMSMGINVLAELCKRASAVLGINYDCLLYTSCWAGFSTHSSKARAMVEPRFA